MSKVLRRQVNNWLKTGATSVEQRLQQPECKRFCQLFISSEQSNIALHNMDEEARLKHFILFLSNYLHESMERTAQLRKEMSEWQQQLEALPPGEEKQQMHRSILKNLEPGRRPRKTGPWQDDQAILSRVEQHLGEHFLEQRIILQRLRFLLPEAMFTRPEEPDLNLWSSAGLDAALQSLLHPRTDRRLRRDALLCLNGVITRTPQKQRRALIESSRRQIIYHLALEPRESPWVQTAALDVISALEPESFIDVIRRRLQHPESGQDLFVRRKLVEMAQEMPLVEEKKIALWRSFMRDPSTYVRQKLAQQLADLRRPVPKSQFGILHEIMAHESHPLVRAALLNDICVDAVKPDNATTVGLIRFLRHVGRTILKHTDDPDSAVVRQAYYAAVSRLSIDLHQGGAEQHSKLRRVFAAGLQARITPLVAQETAEHLKQPVAEAAEHLWILCSEQRCALARSWRELLPQWSLGRWRNLPGAPRQREDNLEIARILGTVCRQDFGIALRWHRKRWQVMRGDRFTFRWWRLWHELTHPHSDKRQGFDHTCGRERSGDVWIPSSILAEMTRTKVPGEAVYSPLTGNGQPDLPLPDDLFAVLNKRNWFLVSANGTLCLKAPESFIKRLGARYKLTSNLEHFAELRNTPASQDLNHPYLQHLQSMGFSIQKKAHHIQDSRAHKTRYYPALIPVAWVQALRDYFHTTFGNNLFELGIFSSGLLSIFVGNRWYLLRKVRRARGKISLVVGGWGTRGKSGTERLKAALFDELGYGYIAKTTGCEAMFLLSFPMTETVENFYYRPYDKATIWEHHQLLCLGARMRQRVFLWECMGLTQDYVEILQRRWSRDDISTITNTYPDHEDIQGPAGYNIPLVMQHFIPQKSHLVTAERQMLPWLKLEAHKQKTGVTAVNELEEHLIPDEILDLFPYDEHRQNIALVLNLAQELGLDADESLWAMANRVVPDIGVLKGFPTARVDNKLIEFINGMSANERFATLENWKRMHFDIALEKSTRDWIVGVVNNRSDRIARSQMFARMLVNDLGSDQFIIMGSGLAQMRNFIDDALDEWLENLERGSKSTDAQLKHLEHWAQMQRIPVSTDLVLERLHHILEHCGQGISFETLPEPQVLKERLNSDENTEVSHADKDIMQWYSAQYHLCTEYIRWHKYLESSSADGKDLHQLQEWIRETFWNKITVIEQIPSNGEQLVSEIVALLPSGLKCRIMGLQNIKGPGLDLVYTMQDWDTCYQACVQIQNAKDTEQIHTAVQKLLQFSEYSLLSRELLSRRMNELHNNSLAQTEEIQAGVRVIINRLKHTDDNPAVTQYGGQKLQQKIWKVLEGLLDAGDAIKRRKKADRIYAELADRRISPRRASWEIYRLIQRQKNGWLGQRRDKQ
ncbi:MAG: hypothetical protein ACQEQK_05790 [Thermodesulfobacteriota bacterium]